MSITVLTGQPGWGKSFQAVRMMVDALERGKMVASNIDLEDDWNRRIPRRTFTYWVRPFAARWFRRRAPERFHYSPDVDELFTVALKGTKEKRGLMVLDEGHEELDARRWSESGRKDRLRFLREHRHLGWDVVIVAQHEEMVDKTIRQLAEFTVHMVALRKVKWHGIPLFGFLPWPAFLAVWFLETRSPILIKRQLFFLNWKRKLYKTHAALHTGANAERARVWLPSPPESRPGASAPPAGGAAVGAGTGRGKLPSVLDPDVDGASV